VQKMCNTDSEGRLYVFLMFTLFPLFVLNGYSNITLTKCITFITLTAFFAITLLVNYITAFKSGKRPEISLKRGFSYIYSPDWFLLLMLVFTAISCVFSPYLTAKNSSGQSLLFFGAGRFDGILFVFIYMVIFWLSARHGKFGQWIATALTITTAIMCVIAMIQLGGTNVFGLYPEGKYKGYYESFVATIGNVDMMSGYLSMAWPLIWMGYILFPFDSKGDVETLPDFIKKANAKDITKAYFTFEKLIRYIYLPVIFLMIYVGLQIDVETFKVVLVAVPVVIIPLLTRSVKNVCRLLESLSFVILAVGFSNAITYTYIESEERTAANFEFTSLLWICIAAFIVMIIGSIILRRFECKTKKPKTKRSKETENTSNPWNYVSFGIAGLEILGVIAVFCYFRFVYIPTKQYGFMYDLYELTRGRISENAGSHRGAIWKYSLKMAKENLFFGTGTGTFAKSFKAFTKEIGYTYYQNKNLDFAHNEYINILCTTGLFGLLTYLGFLFSTAYMSLKTMAKNPTILVLFAAVLGYAVQAFFSFSVVIMTPLFWVLIGLLVKEARETLIINNNLEER